MAYISEKRNNLKVFGIAKSKTLQDFVTTEKDVQKGHNRLPLNLARLYEEDIMSDEEIRNKKDGDATMSNEQTGPMSESIFNQDDISSNIQHKLNAMRRKSSVHRIAKEENTVDTTGQVIYSRKDDKVDIDKFMFEDYKIVKHVGRGTFGKVYLVQNQKTGSYFAMKSIRKDVVL